ncbi:MAG TPA: YihY/virulence factor BrkB family protein [Candidatus Limnocylindria bacterium]|nr:YihY/virulence factor BrkB family protein [Candidatus Limnocylindria bacterium]
MVDRLKRTLHDVDAWLIRHRWTRIGRRAVGGFMEHEALHNAGSMAYFSILSVFQLLVLGVVVMSLFLGEGEARRFVIEQLQAGTPLETDTIAAVIDGVIASRGGIGLVSGAFLLWGALGLFSALNQGIARAFVSARPRGFVQDKLIGLALMALTGLLGVGSIAIGIVTGILQQAASDVVARVPGGGTALWLFGFVTPIVLIFFAFLAVYRIVPNRPVTLGEVWPGAVVATVLWTILRFGFTWYTTNVANYESAFGPISAAISLLVFLYFASVIVLLGAEVARASVIDSREPLPQPAFADAPPVAPAAPRGPATPTSVTPTSVTPTSAGPARVAPSEPVRAVDRRALPAWAMTIGATVAAAVVRWLSGRGRRT